nr:hypothetical protein [Tanacetum cinerariifolium]
MDDLLFGISHHDVVRVCLLLVATIVFMGRETRFYIPDNVLELVDDWPSWNTYPWGEYFWRIFYLRILNVVPRKNERDFKKDKEKVVELPKKKKKPSKSSKKKNKTDVQSPKKMTTYNIYGFAWYLKTDSVGEVLVPDVEQEHNLICLICDTADDTSQLDLNIHSDNHVQDLNSAYQDMDKELNIHCEDHVEEQNSPFQDMDKESNIHSHDTVEHQNLLSMCNEDVLAEFDAIKATVDVIDKRKGEVSTFCLEKELDIVKDRIAVLEKCFKLSLVKPVDMICGEVNKSDDKLDETLDVGIIVDCATLQSSTPPNAMDYQDPQPTDKGSFGFDDMLDLGSKDLVKPVDMMCSEDNISDDRLDETVAGGVIVDRSTLQSSPPPNAMKYQEPEPTDKVNAEVSVYGPVDYQPLNDNVPKGLVKLDDTMSDEDNISDYKLDETVAGGVIVHRATL